MTAEGGTRMDALAALAQAYQDYRTDLENYERKRKPTDGLFGMGNSLQNDPCHERFDERVEQAVNAICASVPSSEEAKEAVQRLLSEAASAWPLAAQWMLRATERHALPLIPYLTQEDAKAFLKQYAARYRSWDRLPAQKKVYQALKAKA